ncbi:BTAD domain-containing putative transcriptional regulator [Nonomuraea maheshkhaliensis]|uniref:BTAD domain-containing putative transcriptional regulator n=1 Tax=Nonomuraea maheshkhaliensis TaxID=419590 RepID=UPI003D156D64
MLPAVLLCCAGRPVSAPFLAEALWGTKRRRARSRTCRRRCTGSGGTSGIRGGSPRAAGVTCCAWTAPSWTPRGFEELAPGGRAAEAAGDLPGAGRLLSQALELWRGPAFSGMSDLRVLATEAPRPAELRLGALELRIDCWSSRPVRTPAPNYATCTGRSSRRTTGRHRAGRGPRPGRDLLGAGSRHRDPVPGQALVRSLGERLRPALALTEAAGNKRGEAALLASPTGAHFTRRRDHDARPPPRRGGGGDPRRNRLSTRTHHSPPFSPSTFRDEESTDRCTPGICAKCAGRVPRIFHPDSSSGFDRV